MRQLRIEFTRKILSVDTIAFQVYKKNRIKVKYTLRENINNKMNTNFIFLNQMNRLRSPTPH